MHHHLDINFIQVLVLLAIGVVVTLVEWLLYRTLLPRLKKHDSIWGYSFLSALHWPLLYYIGFLIISFMVTVVVHFISQSNQMAYDLAVIRRLGTLLFLLWFVLRFIKSLEDGIAAHAQNPTNAHAGAQLARIILVIFVFLMGLQTAGIQMSGVLAFGGVTAAVVGFAAKDILGNFLGGMIIYWDRPFLVGDWVRSPDRNIEGTVEHIGWRVTRIRTFDKRPLYVPNGILTTIALENPSRMTHRRIQTTLGVRYDDMTRVAALVQAIDALLRQHPEIDDMQRISVGLSDFGPSSVNILIYAFTKTTQWINFQVVRQEIFLKIMEIVEAHGAECAFPTQTLHIPDGVFLTEKMKEQQKTT